MPETFVFKFIKIKVWVASVLCMGKIHLTCTIYNTFIKALKWDLCVKM